jgi:hypothetical protein
MEYSIVRIRFITLSTILLAFLQGPIADAQTKTENVILITYDGLRHQEVFGGIDERLLNVKDGQVEDVPGLRALFKRDTPKQRREALLPFFWGTIAKKGIVLGDPAANSVVRVTNNQLFSYPGYNEILTGFPDPKIRSNAKKQNENVTVLEWINQQAGFEGKVRAFCSWDVFPFIINEERSGVPVNAGWEKFDDLGDKEVEARLNTLTEELPHLWGGIRYDLLTFEGAVDALKHHKPRVLYIGFGETDDWAHEGRYDMYIESAHRTDVYIERIWDLVQSLPQYKDKTTIILTSDHGRGDVHPDWKSHSVKVDGSDRVWTAVMGPDTPKKGVLKNTDATQGQAAATIAALLNLDYNKAQPKAAPVLKEAIK